MKPGSDESKIILQKIKTHLQPKPSLITFLVNMEEGDTAIYYFKLQKLDLWIIDSYQIRASFKYNRTEDKGQNLQLLRKPTR